MAAAGSGDTLYETYEALPPAEPARYDTTVLIGKARYRLHLEAITSSQSTPAVDRYQDRDGRWHVDRFAAREGTCRLQLWRPTGEVVFATTLTKAPFLPVLDRQIGLRSDAVIPKVEGYLPAFGGLLLSFQFWIPYSDVGQSVLCLLNLRGEVQWVKPLNQVWDGCDGAPAVSPDGQTIVTCYELIRANGSGQPFTADGSALAAFRFLTGGACLIVFDQPDQPNAFIRDRTGQQVAAFACEAFIPDFSSRLAEWRDRRRGVLYLLDATHQHLVAIPEEQPERVRTIPFAGLPATTADTGRSEVCHEMLYSVNDSTTAVRTLCIDTLTGQFRLKR